MRENIFVNCRYTCEVSKTYQEHFQLNSKPVTMTITDTQMTKWLKELINKTFIQRTKTTSQPKLTQYQ